MNKIESSTTKYTDLTLGTLTTKATMFASKMIRKFTTKTIKRSNAKDLHDQYSKLTDQRINDHFAMQDKVIFRTISVMLGGFGTMLGGFGFLYSEIKEMKSDMLSMKSDIGELKQLMIESNRRRWF